MSQKLKALLIIEQCNPEMSSVPLVGYKFYQGIRQLVETTLVTHQRNQAALERVKGDHQIVYIEESELTKKYYPFMANLTLKGRNNWPLANVLGYPIYAEFNHKVYQKFKAPILQGEYDIVHALTPIQPRSPVKAVKACQRTPFLLGPVNGGVPFPPGFQTIARQEFAYLNFLRAVGRTLLPGYVETYKKADKILAGSTYTFQMVKKMFDLPDRKLQLFYENGIAAEFLTPKAPANKSSKINLLFVGRLVPYKCPDVVIEAVSQLAPSLQQKTHLTIVGDGSERELLEARVQELNLSEIVTFTGWVNQQETLDYYRNSDIFCFPSIREFGGAVVMEAMACGLPCIVVNNGGIAEYVTDETGFKIEPISREYLTQELTKKITLLAEDETLRKTMSDRSVVRAKEFEWEQKAIKIVEIYEKMISEKKSCLSREELGKKD
ncbi:MAG: glycosyltransferase family 4 protein [Actinomycetota bacterium]